MIPPRCDLHDNLIALFPNFGDSAYPLSVIWLAREAGRDAVARVLGGTTTSQSKRPSSMRQRLSICTYIVSRLVLA